jgi:hypothetical protein
MKVPVMALLICSFLLLPSAERALSQSYFKRAVVPKGADDRSNQVYPGFDFEDVIFTREYFYSLEEGTRHFRRQSQTPWTELKFDESDETEVEEAAPKTE